MVFQTSTAPLAAVQIRVLGGAVARVPVAATAFAHRERKILVNVAAAYGRPDGSFDPRSLGYRSCGGAGAIGGDHGSDHGPHGETERGDGAGRYVNFMGDEVEARVQRHTRARPGPSPGDQGSL